MTRGRAADVVEGMSSVTVTFPTEPVCQGAGDTVEGEIVRTRPHRPEYPYLFAWTGTHGRQLTRLIAPSWIVAGEAPPVASRKTPMKRPGRRPGKRP